MKKLSIRLIPACLAFAALAAGCFSPWENGEASLTLDIGGGTNRAAWNVSGEMIAEFSGTIALEGPGNMKRSVEIKAGTGAVSLRVVPGKWNAYAKVFHKERFVLEGSAAFDVVAGHENRVEIAMTRPALQVTISGEGYMGETLEAVVGGVYAEEEAHLSYRWFRVVEYNEFYELGTERAVTLTDNERNFDVYVEVSYEANKESARSEPLNVSDYLPIRTRADLAKIGKNAEYHLEESYILLNDIDLEGSAANPWPPIGAGPPGEPFSGIFDGAGHTISGLYIDNTGASHQGLFSMISGIVRHFTLEVIQVKGDDTVGAVAGTNNGTIEYVTVAQSPSGSIVASTGEINVGGVVGTNDGIISRCSVSVGTLQSAVNYSGGVAGVNDGDGTIENCYVVGGTLQAVGEIAGGIAGDNRGTIQNCYSKFDLVKANSIMGGIAGQNSQGTVRNCVALHGEIQYSEFDDRTARVSGTLETPIDQKNNYAKVTMKMRKANSDGTFTGLNTTDVGLEGKDGADIENNDELTLAWWTASTRWYESTADGAKAWDFTTVWYWNAAKGLPDLREPPQG